jgi:hypothetical protein
LKKNGPTLANTLENYSGNSLEVAKRLSPTQEAVEDLIGIGYEQGFVTD